MKGIQRNSAENIKINKLKLVKLVNLIVNIIKFAKVQVFNYPKFSKTIKNHIFRGYAETNERKQIFQSERPVENN